MAWSGLRWWRTLGGTAITGIGRVERTATGVYTCTVGVLVVLAGAVHALVPGTLTRMRDGAIAWVLSFVEIADRHQGRTLPDNSDGADRTDRSMSRSVASRNEP